MLNATTRPGLAIVIGAGTMGGGIAAQLVNAGWSVKLLDLPGEDPARRNAPAAAGLDRLLKSRPPLLFLPEYSERIAIGNTQEDLASCAGAAWVVEAIAENLNAKRLILEAIEASAGADAVITSNTSGLSLAEMSAGRSADFKRRFFGAHFLNPPRYLKLLEVIPTAASDPAIVEGFISFAEQMLGHRVVMAKDSPGFISTRIWIQHLLEGIRLACEMALTIEEVDFLTGPLIGRPNSGTFRMADIVGLDVVCAIAANQYAGLTHEIPDRSLLSSPILSDLVSSGRLGDKSGGGFYRRTGKTIESLDLKTGDYRARIEPAFPELSALVKCGLAERFAGISADRKSRPGKYLNALLDSLHMYVCKAGPDVADDVLAIDRVMRWGFQWEVGPFEIEDLRTGTHTYYPIEGAERKASVFNNGVRPIISPPEYLSIDELIEDGKTVIETPSGALLDMGDGVACIDLRTKMNTFGPPLCDFINQALERAQNEFTALVIGTAAANFSAGFNLKLFLEAEAKGDFAAIDRMLNQVQHTFLALKYSPLPTVAAVKGYTLGGGCECAFSCSAVQAAPELIMGLPELPAGLIPSGGAFKELLHRSFEAWDGKEDAFAFTERAFDVIVALPNSANAAHAKKLGLLRVSDGISSSADRLLFDAKRRAVAIANSGYVPPVKKPVWAVGAQGLARLRMAIHQHCSANPQITPHDRLIAERAALVMCGGPLSAPGEVSEQYMLNLEREVFLTLMKEPKSLERIRHILETGKPLNN